tara:strand:+ start:295 stop:471 length:177 start_codon:yes stop_codon:yes gene_type:complete
MDDELEIDASGCWVRKNAQVFSESPLRSQSEQYKKLVYSTNANDNIDHDKQNDILIIS